MRGGGRAWSDRGSPSPLAHPVSTLGFGGPPGGGPRTYRYLRRARLPAQDAAFESLAAALKLSSPIDLFNATYNATAANITALHVIPGETWEPTVRGYPAM
jgi:hypothetical protein